MDQAPGDVATSLSVPVRGSTDVALTLHVNGSAEVFRQDGFQGGFCTPGQVLSAGARLQEGRAGSDEDVREFMSGNLCRCAAYPNIVAAIREVAERGGE